jgi:phosphatidate cytidylyltransferase
MSSTPSSDTSNLHQRNVERDINTNVTRLLKAEKTTAVVTTEDDEMEPLPSQPSGAHMLDEHVFIQNYMRYFDQLLSGFNPRWRNWTIRGIFSFIMIAAFTKLVSMGPLVVSLVVLLIQIKCFHEIITIGYVVYKSHNLPWFRTLSWFFLFTSDYWLYGESLINHFGFLMNKNNFLQPLVTYHRMIVFLLYTSGFVGFVLSLKKTYYLKQFTLFGYTHITLMILVTSSHQMIQNICEGIVLQTIELSIK